MPKKVSPMSRSAASPAAMHASHLAAVLLRERLVKCMTLFAPSAELPAKFLSSPEMTALYIAASASPTEDKHLRHYEERSLQGRSFSIN